MIRYAGIAGFPGYRVGDDGTVWTAKLGAHGGWRPMKTPLTTAGYPRVTLSHLNVQQNSHVHTLVAEAFLGPRPDPRAVCRHLDGNPQNNNVSNLAWGTYADNEADKARHGRRPVGERVGGAKLTDAAAIRLRSEYAAGTSLRALAQAYRLDTTTVIAAVHGRTFSHLPVPDYSGRTISRRQQRGEASKTAKLCEGDVARIRDMKACRCTLHGIATWFGVSIGAVDHVVKGRTWTHV